MVALEGGILPSQCTTTLTSDGVMTLLEGGRHVLSEVRVVSFEGGSIFSWKDIMF